MHRKKARVVIDTNVLYAGLYSSKGASYQVLQAVAMNNLEPVISTTLIFEYEDVLKRNKATLKLSDEEIEKVLDYFCFKSKHQAIHFLWRPYLTDANDDHLLELAVASGTNSIVTHNIRDFTGTAKFGVRAVTPKKLLEEIA